MTWVLPVAGMRGLKAKIEREASLAKNADAGSVALEQVLDLHWWGFAIVEVVGLPLTSELLGRGRRKDWIFARGKVEYLDYGKSTDSRFPHPDGGTLSLRLETAAIPCRIHYCQGFPFGDW